MRVGFPPCDPPHVHPEDLDKINAEIDPGLVWVTLYTFPHKYGRTLEVPWTWAYNYVELVDDQVLAQWFRQGYQLTFHASACEIGCALQQLAAALDDHLEDKAVTRGLALADQFPDVSRLIMEARAAEEA